MRHGANLPCLVLTGSEPSPREGAVVIGWDSWLDDAEWEGWCERLTKGKFSSALLELPLETFSHTYRTAEKPLGARGLQPKDRDWIRKETVWHRRIATAIGLLAVQGKPCAVWSGVSPQVSPFGLEAWGPSRDFIQQLPVAEGCLWSSFTDTARHFPQLGQGRLSRL